MDFNPVASIAVFINQRYAVGGHELGDVERILGIDFQRQKAKDYNQTPNSIQGERKFGRLGEWRKAGHRTVHAQRNQRVTIVFNGYSYLKVRSKSLIGAMVLVAEAEVPPHQRGQDHKFNPYVQPLLRHGAIKHDPNQACYQEPNEQ